MTDIDSILMAPIMHRKVVEAFLGFACLYPCVITIGKNFPPVARLRELPRSTENMQLLQLVKN